MREIDLDDLKISDLIDAEGLIKEYEKYLKEEMDYSDIEAKFASRDMENPYDIPYVEQEYEGDVEIDGVMYEVRSCKTNLNRCGWFNFSDTPAFEFYMLFNMEDVPNQLVGEYLDARKMFIV